MATSARLIAFFLGLVLMTVPLWARAAIDTTPSIWHDGISGTFPTNSAACASALASSAYNFTTSAIVSGTTPTRSASCNGTNKTGTPVVDSWRVTVSEGCPTGFTINSSLQRCQKTVTTCPAPEVENPTTGLCEPPECPAAGQQLAGESVYETPSLSLTVCLNLCSGQGVASATHEGRSYVWGPITSDGGACTGSGTGGEPPPAVEPVPPAPLPQAPGMCPGTVNGTTVSVPCGTATAGGPSTETGAPETAPSGPDGPASGASGTNATTTCIGQFCTTTTTTTTDHGDGTATTTPVTETETKDEFCATNPGHTLCQEDKSSFAGTCAATACTGDAIQCAIAQEQARRNCQLMDTATTLSDIGNAAANGQNPANHPKNEIETQVIALSSMISTLPLFGSSGQCPSDQSITVQGQVIALPFASMCPYLQMLGAAFMAACYLAAAFIVFKRS